MGEQRGEKSIMYIKKATVTVIQSSVAAVSGYTTDINGLLSRVQYASTIGTPSSGIKCNIGTEGSSLNRILKFEKLAAGTTSFYPRTKVVNAKSTALSSSGLDGLIPLGDGRLKVNLSAASSANSPRGITFTFWYY